MKTYRINEEKVEELIASFKSTHFWPNIVGRKTANGKVEIAYGHHRKKAGEKHYGKDHKIEVIIEDLDDATMIKMMAAENGDFWKTDFITEMENVATVVENTLMERSNCLLQIERWKRSRTQYASAPSFLVVKGSERARAQVLLCHNNRKISWTFRTRWKRAKHKICRRCCCTSNSSKEEF